MDTERRMQTRYSINLPVKICGSDEPKALDVAQSVDISAGGLRMNITRFFKPEECLDVKFLINSESSNVMPVQVIWVEDENGDIRCGVKFLES